MQTVGYQILFDLKFLMRSLSLVGTVLLILAENRGTANHTVFDLPTLTGDKPKVSEGKSTQQAPKGDTRGFSDKNWVPTSII